MNVVRYVLGGALVGYGALQILGRRAGSTAPERHMHLAGDELVARPQMRAAMCSAFQLSGATATYNRAPTTV